MCGRARYRMHGGAKGSGAPLGNRNALKHGNFTREGIAERRPLRKMICQMERMLGEIEK